MHRRELLKWASAALVGCAGEARPSELARRERPAEQAAEPAEPAPAEPPRAPEPTPTRPITEADWARFGETLEGRLVRASDETYDAARRLFDPRFDDIRPAAIAYCESESDVQRCLALCRTHALPFAARAGGHSYAGYSSGPGLVCDVSPLSRVRLDASSGLASIGAGAKLIDVYAGLSAQGGVTIPGGSCPSVGIAGLTLGGGQGVLGRKFGLTCDRVRSLRLVTASGERLECDAERNADLFWASLGGGGGNFGVVTRLTFETAPVERLVRFALPFPWQAAAEVIAGWQEWGPDAPDELWSKCEIGARAQGASIAIHGVFIGAEASLGPLLDGLERRIGARPRRRRVESAPLLESMLTLGGCIRRTLDECHLPPEGTLGRGIHVSRSDVVERSLSSAGVAALLEAVEAPIGAGRGRVGLDALGGAIGRVAPDATAFVHRRARYVAQYAAFYGRRASPTEIAASVGWLDRLYDAMRPHTGGRAYQNYIDPRQPDWAAAYYGDNLPRLRRIKAATDPEQLLRFAQSITPASV